MQLLKQSTASTVYVGPVLDSAGAAVTTAVVGDFRLIKNGTAATLSGATVTHDANGYYTVALTTTNTDTTGRLTLAVGNTAMSMSTHRYSVLLASVYDALITNATNATGGLPTATGSISALAGAISTLTAAGVRSELATELNRIDATISSRSSQTSVDTVAGYVDTEVAAIKAKTDLITTFPTNFSSLAIAAGTGAVTVNNDAFGNTFIVTNLASQSSVDTLATYVDTEVAAIKAKTDNLPASPASVSDIPTANQNRDAVLNALPSAGYVNGSFGDRMLISTSDQREVAVTGSNHIAADIHEFQAGVITAGDFAAGAIDANALAADAATEIATAVAATQALSRLDSMIESDGAGQFRFDTIALSMGAGGGGGGTDWTANERTAIRSILGIPTSGTTPTDPTVGILDEIRDKTALITTGTIASSIPVTASGQIDGPLVIGDDYLSANGRAFIWTVALPSAFVIATSTCKLGMEYQDEEGTYSFTVTGTVTDAGSGNVTLTFDVPRTTTGTLGPGWYRWSVEIASASGTEVTRVKSSHNKLVEWVEKQT